MKQQHALAILYDLASTIGGEVSLSPLLTKTLQRIMYHTGVPCGMVLLNSRAGTSEGSAILTTAIGDRALMKSTGSVIRLPAPWRSIESYQLSLEPELITAFPCRREKYRSALLLPIPGEGMIVLLCNRTDPASSVPLEMIFPPVLANLAKSIYLCRLNDKQKELLKSVVAERTAQLQHALETIDRQRQSLQAILNHAPLGIWMLGTDRKIKFVNPALTEALGVSEQAFIDADNYEGLFPAEIEQTQREADRICLNEKSMHESRVSLPCPDNITHTFDIIRSPVLDEKGEAAGLVGMAIDITGRLQAEKEKMLIQKRIEHTQRLESLGILAGGIAHDFNNILTAIMGNAELARYHSAPDATTDKYIDAITAASQSAADLCGQMLAYSGKGKFTVRPVNLSETVNHMTKLLEVSIAKHVNLKYHIDEELPAVNADISQIQQVIMNLITNANEAIGDKPGTISISTGSQIVDEGYLAGAYLPDPIDTGLYAYIEVSDTGCGMDQETVKHLFEPFFTTKFTGRGLGMSAVLGIVRGHQGTIKVYSEPGKGSTFKALFPCSNEAAIPQTETELKKSDWKGEGTVLVVDDDPMVLEIGEAIMKSIGFKTLAARDGVEGIEVYRQHQDEIIAVFLDMTMPRKGGKETFAELRKINPGVRVVLTSGYNEQDAVQSFAGKGLAGFMQKPYRVAELRKKMQELLSTEES